MRPWRTTKSAQLFNSFTASGGIQELHRLDRLEPRRPIRRSRPGSYGRVGNIEKQILQQIMFAGPDKLFTTGELARAIYANPTWDQDFNFRKKGEPPPKLKSWHYLAIRKAAPTFADCMGRSTARGRPWLWRPRPHQFFGDARRVKRGRKQSSQDPNDRGTTADNWTIKCTVG